ncbi:MAG: hypothetical protein JWM74_4436 [Myxococcaceae bacterium]|nr:hypothetical protein [Myxococcaceae bacterium]
MRFHDFTHYYLGPKYFAELGYLQLYDCLVLADREVADEENRAPRISGGTRDLADILTVKTYEQSVAECRAEARPRFSDARWAAFKNDIHALGRLTHDGTWNGVVFDAGYNPPPSIIVVSSPLTNLIPLEAGSLPTYLLATCLDLVLLIICAFMTRKALGDITLAVFATLFGATFVSDYSWNGGSFFRFTWFVALVLGILALKQRRWALAGALLAFATCERIFPVAFAAAGMLPIAIRARDSVKHRAILKRFGVSFAVVVAVLVSASLIAYGPSAWRVFFMRIRRHDDVFHVLHIGLKKVLVFRTWMPNQNFRGQDGNLRFRAWNLRLLDTWIAMRPLVIPLQTVIAAATAWSASRRLPHEAALLGGVVFMFTFNLPANYYYCIVALIPALALRAAATATTPARRWRDFAVFVVFALFWTFTFLAPQLPGDDITSNHRISCAMLAFLIFWLASWSDVDVAKWRAWRARRAGPAIL